MRKSYSNFNKTPIINAAKSLVSLSLALCLILLAGGCRAKDAQISSELSATNSGSYDGNIAKSTKEELYFSYPKSEKLSVNSETLEFSGSCTMKDPLTVNGRKVSTTKDGLFSVPYTLKKGNNKVIFQCGKVRKVFYITYTLPLIKSYTPSDKSLTLPEGTVFSVSVTALAGSRVTAYLKNTATELLAYESIKDDGKSYSVYRGVLSAPKSSTEKLLLKFKAERNGKVQAVEAAAVKIQKNTLSTGLVNISGRFSPLPESGTHSSYANIQDGYIATLTGTTTETFSGDTVDDYSRPTNNYLPEGTQDYCMPQKIYDTESGKKYYLLKSNYRVYANSSVRIKKGTLPRGNTVTFVRGGTSGKYSELVFDVDWKAPFRLRLDSQKYKNSKVQDYSISAVTYSYVDITFCYSSKIKGQIKISGSPLFKRAKWIKNEKDYTLRLYLKKAGAFYGWKAEYNKTGQLVFSFLNPIALKKSHTNRYGYSLKGVKIVLDAGHGGTDSGTYCVAGKKHEKYYTLLYANSLRQKLLSLGATVAMTRSSDSTVSLSSRYRYITTSGADLCVSLHFNGSVSSSAHGYFMGYFNPFTYKASSYLSSGVSRMNLISKYSGGLDWHYFNLSRVSACPVVLTENGFLTNPDDFGKIRNAAFRNNYTEGLTAGIVSYFGSVKSGTISESTASIRKIKPISKISGTASKKSSSEKTSKDSSSYNKSSSEKSSFASSITESAESLSSRSKSSSYSTSPDVSSERHGSQNRAVSSADYINY